MKNLLSSIFDDKNPQQSPPSADHLALQNELRQLQLELQSRDETITRLRTQIDSLLSVQVEHTRASLASDRDELLQAVATPAAQLITLGHLLEKQDKPVQARDIINVARRILRVFENYGLRFEGQIGEVTSFDPNLHQPLNAADAPSSGQAVIIRVPAVRAGEKILVRAGIEIQQVQP